MLFSDDAVCIGRSDAYVAGRKCIAHVHAQTVVRESITEGLYRLGWEILGNDLLLLAANVDVYAVVVAVVVAAGGVEARVETLLFTAVLETGVATVVLVDTDVLFLGHAYGLRATAVVLGDADVFAEAFFVTGRGGFLGSSWWLLTFPSSALDRDLLFSLDLFGLLGVFVGRRKDAERDSVVWLALVVSKMLLIVLLTGEERYDCADCARARLLLGLTMSVSQ